MSFKKCLVIGIASVLSAYGAFAHSDSVTSDSQVKFVSAGIPGFVEKTILELDSSDSLVNLIPDILLSDTAGFLSPADSNYVSVIPSSFQIPFQTPNDVETQFLLAKEAFIKVKDTHGVFAGIYAKVSQEIAKLKQQNRFKNPDWVTKITVNYANIYRHALYADSQAQIDEVPLAWQFAFNSNRSVCCSVPLQLMLSVNAHISRDLVFALMQSNTDFSSEDFKADYAAIGQAFDNTFNEGWDLIKQYDERFRPEIYKQASTDFINKWIAEKRKRTWDNAQKLSQISDPDQRAQFIDNLEKTVAKKSIRYLKLGLFNQ